jgi:hypothetical protein
MLQQQSMQEVQVKLCIMPQGVSRRFAVSNDLSLHDFLIQISSFLNGDIIRELQYLDEENDLILVNSEREWKNALQQQKNTILRVRVTTTSRQCRKKPSKPFIMVKLLVVLIFMLTHPLLSLLIIAGIIAHAKCSPDGKLARTYDLLKEKYCPIVAVFVARLLYEIEPRFVIPYLMVAGTFFGIKYKYKWQCMKQPLFGQPQSTTPGRVATRQDQQYPTQIQTLHSLGFQNDKLNQHLLNTFGGDVNRVVSALLQLSS